MWIKADFHPQRLVMLSKVFSNSSSGQFCSGSNFLADSAYLIAHMDDAQTILIVEDNDFVRMQIVRYLKEVGYETVEATDGNDALAHFSRKIALAIVDVRMEPMGGLEFVKNIRGKDLDTPIILVTGDQNTDLLEQATRWGVDAVLLKPVMKDRLVKAVERILQTSGKSSA